MPAPASPGTRSWRAAVARGLAGLECLSGIPGTVGGTPIQNVGAYGQEVAGVIEAVTVFDRGPATLVDARRRRSAGSVSDEPLQARRCRPVRRLRRDVPAAAGPADAGVSAMSSAISKRRGDRRAGGRRRPRTPCCDPAAEGNGDRCARSRHAQRRIVLHESGRDGRRRDGDRARPRSASRASQPAASGEDSGGLADRAGRVRARATRDGPRRHLDQAPAGDHQPRRRDGARRPALWRRGSSGGSATASAISLRPEPVFFGF